MCTFPAARANNTRTPHAIVHGHRKVSEVMHVLILLYQIVALPATLCHLNMRGGCAGAPHQQADTALANSLETT